MKVKSILVSQPKPETEKSPYFDIAQKYKVKVDFRPFIQVEGVDVKEFRKDRVNILQHTGVIFTSRHSADHFFRICNEMRLQVPESMKYFCMSESIAYYLQKYVQFRKRKIFHGKQTFSDLNEVIKKHATEHFLFPCSDIKQDEITTFLEKHKIKHTRTVMFKTVISNLKDLEQVNYDVLVFFSPMGVKSLLKNFPKFRQNETKIAAFGAATAKEVLDSNLNLDIYSPTPQAPSMAMALEHYIKSPEKAAASFVLPAGILDTKPVSKKAAVTKASAPKAASKQADPKALATKTPAAKASVNKSAAKTPAKKAIPKKAAKKAAPVEQELVEKEK